MNGTKMTTWRVALLVGVALGCGSAPAGEVTVIGSGGVCPQELNVGHADAMSATSSCNMPQSPNPNVVCPANPFNSSWYTRLEYFHWGNLMDPSTDFQPSVDSGLLYTLGYVHRFESQRVRFELFGGVMQRSGFATYTDEVPNLDVIGGTTSISRTSHAYANAAYFGGRVEYECLWDVNVDEWLPITIVAGIGNRAWNRSVYDCHTDGGRDLGSESDVWWTIYPYVGVEKRWDLEEYREIFASSRIGCTVLTYNHYDMDYAPAFYPNPGLTAQLECGIRSKHLFLSGFFEVMTWQNSNNEHLHGDPSDTVYYLPGSQMYTSGFRLGVTY